MLDFQIVEELKTVFSRLESVVEIVYDRSDHEKQVELIEMLIEVASTSDKITITNSDKISKNPHFTIKYKGEENGISFQGVPGGHEFTSLILAILNSDGKGRLPDKGIIERIRRLKGPIDLKTYVSLECENCPEVVQDLNMIALFHPKIKHQMIDGAIVQDEIESLGIQGVPTVLSSGKIISSGKVGFLDLLNILEEKFGTEGEKKVSNNLGEYDVIVIGAGPAGASSAIYSARKGLKTAVIADRIGGQVQDTKGIENFISVLYTEGPELSAHLVEHMAEYNIDIFEHRRVRSVKDDNIKIIELDSGEILKTNSLIVATGAKWRELGVPGEKEHVGRGVAYCPHCDGPYYKGKDVVVVGGGNSGVEAAIDLSGIAKSVTLLEYLPELKADKVLVKKLKEIPNVKIIKNAKTNKIVGDEKRVIEIEYEDRKLREVKKLGIDGVFVQIGLIPNSLFLKGIVDMNKYGEIVVDNRCRTNVSGIYAAGDVTTVPFKQIVIAMGEGAKAALAAFEDQIVDIKRGK